MFYKPPEYKKKNLEDSLFEEGVWGERRGVVCVYVGGRWVGKKGDCFRLRYIQLFAKLASDSRS